MTLDALGAALGCGKKSGNGGKVAGWWAERDIDSIKTYCQEDVRLAYRVFCRLTYQEPKQIPSALQPGSVGPARAAIPTRSEEDVCPA